MVSYFLHIERIANYVQRRAAMSIKANILRDSQGNITVQMEGGLTYEHTQSIRDELMGLVSDNPYAIINFDLGGIDFVGSSGICHFVETLKIINNREENKRIGLSNVKPEFRKVFRLYELAEEDFLLRGFEMDSDETEFLNTQFGNRKKTFQN
jgi:anti-sigma B factor antagonist